MQNLIKIISLSLLLTSCVSAEYLNQQSVCRQEAYSRFPAVIVTQQVMKTRPVEQFDGSVTCTTVNNTNSNAPLYTPYNQTNQILSQTNQVGVTRCEQGKRIVHENYIDLVNIDINQSARDSFTDNCTHANCLQLYGNSSCKIK